MTHKEYLTQIEMEMRIARIRKRMSATEVSKLSGLSKGTVCDIERGEKDAKILTYKRIADAIGTEMKDFF